MEIHRYTLDNGFEVVLIPDHTLPITEVRGWIKGGPACRSGSSTLDGQRWLGRIVPSMLTRGTNTYSREEFNGFLDEYALIYGCDVSGNSRFFVEWWGRAQSVFSKQLLEIMQESLCSPAFPEAELTVLKNQRETSVRRAESDPGTRAQRGGLRMLYGRSHPKFPLETEESIDQLRLVSRDDLQSFWEMHYAPDCSGVVVVGSIDLDIITADIQEIFGKWSGAHNRRDIPDFDIDAKDLYGLVGHEEKTVFIPEKSSATLWVGQRVPIGSTHPDYQADYPALFTAVNALGSGPHSRLFRHVREECRLSYSVGAALPYMFVIPGHVTITADTNPDNILETQEEVFRVLGELYDYGITAEELEREKKVLRGNGLIYRSSLKGIAQEFVINAIAGSSNFIADVDERILKLTVEEVNEVVRKYLDPSLMKIVRAGTVD